MNTCSNKSYNVQGDLAPSRRMAKPLYVTQGPEDLVPPFTVNFLSW